MPALPVDIPSPVKEYLLVSSKGTKRLLKVVEHLVLGEPLAEVEQERSRIRLISDLALAAWEHSPFDLVACSTLSQLHEQAPFLPGEVAEAVRRGAIPPQCGPAVMHALDTAFKHSQASEEISTFLDSTRNLEPNSLFWMHFACTFALAENKLDWFSEFLTNQKGLPPYLRRIVQGDILFAQEQWERAMEKYQEASSRFESPGLMIRKAEALYRAGHRAEATQLWQSAFAARTWDYTLALRLGDILQERDLPQQEPHGQGAVLLYSWNHAQDLDIALSSLAATTPPNIPLLLLDNGSSDDTAMVSQRWKRELGNRLSLITLPVNIGAPAARNWLLSTPLLSRFDWVVFLDDDAVVPQNWLNYFGTAMKEYPNAGIFGCQVKDLFAPQIIQSADLHYEQPLSPASKGIGGPNFTVSNFHAQVPARGEHDYMRMCVSVTGCCHLVTRPNLDAVGHFNLMFSPSQFDDYERDIRSGIKGFLPVYNGHLTVQHRKRSGLIKNIGRQTAANVNGNSLKAQNLYSEDQMESLRQLDMANLKARLDECLHVIYAALF
jgi:Predicted glycosyltransferases